MKRYSVKEFLEDPINNSDEYFGFYDWFCNTDSLESRVFKLVPKVKFLVEQGIIDADSTYVWFKNICSADGTLYDDIRFSTLDDAEDFLGGVCPSTRQRGGFKTRLWTLKGEYITHETRTWSDLKRKITTDLEFKQDLKLKFSS